MFCGFGVELSKLPFIECRRLSDSFAPGYTTRNTASAQLHLLQSSLIFYQGRLYYTAKVLHFSFLCEECFLVQKITAQLEFDMRNRHILYFKRFHFSESSTDQQSFTAGMNVKTCSEISRFHWGMKPHIICQRGRGRGWFGKMNRRIKWILAFTFFVVSLLQISPWRQARLKPRVVDLSFIPRPTCSKAPPSCLIWLALRPKMFGRRWSFLLTKTRFVFETTARVALWTTVI